MGAECSMERNNLNDYRDSTKSTSFEQVEQNEIISLNCKSYSDYNKKIIIFKDKLLESLKKIQLLNDFSPIKRYLFVIKPCISIR